MELFFARVKNDIHNLFRKLAGKPPVQYTPLWPWKIKGCTHCGRKFN